MICLICCQALTAWEALCKKYGVVPDKEYKEAALEVAWQCDATIYEGLVLRAIQKWLNGDKKDAKTAMSNWNSEYDHVPARFVHPVIARHAAKIA